MTTTIVIAVFGLIVLASLIVAPRRVTADGFFSGTSQTGSAPGLWTLVFSQVTTWIFARSLMNSAILGYYYGIAGTLAYAAYYGSFLTGMVIVGHIRAQGGRSVQDWLSQNFGAFGTRCYDFVVAVRLLSEVFANLLVVGLIFAAVLPGVPGAQEMSIVLVAILGLAYSAWGGLTASIRTDVLQMSVFLVVFAAAFFALISAPDFSLNGVLTASGTAGSYNGWVLLAVAFLQVFSYPAHDPVMMDRGFIADEKTTRWAFLHAFWISTLCIIGFGFFGIQAGLAGAEYGAELIGTWAVMFDPWVFSALMISLLVSALSTLDSALSSASRLVVEELRLAPRTLPGGRSVMVLFMGAGAALTIWGNSTLFDAVAVSGTASMFLTPVLIVGLLWGRKIAIWSYMVAFAAALVGASAYLFRDAPAVAAILPEGHKYEQLFAICCAVLITGFAAVLVGARRARGVASP